MSQPTSLEWAMWLLLAVAVFLVAAVVFGPLVEWWLHERKRRRMRGYLR